MANKKKSGAARTLTAVPATVEVPWGTPDKIMTLDEIIAAGPGGVYTSPEVHLPLLEQRLVEINAAMVNESGEVLTRATAKGVASMSMQVEPAVAVISVSDSEYPDPVYPEDLAVSSYTGSFSIDDNVPLPESSGRGRRGRTNYYPFDQLQVGQSFFVAATPEKPNMAKALASTVSSAMGRYAEKIPGQFKTNRKGEQVQLTRETRKFVIRNVEGGARIWRTV